MKKNKGFTMMELLIVVAVIVVLAAIALPTFKDAQKRSNQEADIQAVSALYTELQAIYSIKGEIPSDTNTSISGMAEAFNGDMSEFGDLTFSPETGWRKGGTVTFSVDTDGKFTATCN